MTEEIVFKTTVDTGASKKEVDGLKESLKGAGNEAEKSFSVAEQKLKSLNEKIEKGDLSFREYSRAVKEYQTIALQAGETSPIGLEALKNAGDLKDRLADVSTATKNLGADGANMQAGLQLGSSVIAGYQGFQSVTAMLGVENEALLSTLTKLEAAQGALMAVETLRSSLEKESFLMLKAKVLWTNLTTAASNKLTIAQIAQNGVTGIATAVTGGLTVAMGVLNAIMLLNPVFLLIGAFALLAGAFAVFGGSAETAEEDNKKLNATLERQSKLLEAQNSTLVKNAQFKLDMAKASGASAEEQFKLELDLMKENENARKRTLKFEHNTILQKKAMYRKALAEDNEDLAKSIRDEINQHRSKYSELKSQDGDYFRGKKIRQTEEAKRISDEAKEKAEEEAKRAQENAREAQRRAKERRDKERQEQEKHNQKLLELERNLIDLANNAIQDDELRKRMILAENHKRELEDLKKQYGEKSTLVSELEKKQAIEKANLDKELQTAKETKQKEEEAKKSEAQQKEIVLQKQNEIDLAWNDFNERMILMEEMALIQRDNELKNKDLTEGEKNRIQIDYDSKLREIDKQRLDEQAKQDQAVIAMKQAMASNLSSILGNISQIVGENTKAGKASAIAQIGIDTATGFMGGLRLAQKAALETPTPVGKALVYASFATSQFLAVKKASQSAKQILGAGGSVDAPSISAPNASGSNGGTSANESQLQENNNTLINQGSTNQIVVLDSEIKKVGNQVSKVSDLNSL
jgi:hypothetical protein